MLRSNKGSILVTTLIFFSIIATVCISCIALTYSNNNYSKLQYDHTRIKELALSGIEITKSNILSNTKYAIEKFDKKDDFTKYFLGNARDIIGDISESGLNNVRVNIQGKVSEDSDDNISFVIESACKEEQYTKRVRANVKILNPWTNYEGTTETIEIDATDSEYEQKNNIEKDESDILLDENNEYISGNIDNAENHKMSLNEKELVIIYNYEEN